MVRSTLIKQSLLWGGLISICNVATFQTIARLDISMQSRLLSFVVFLIAGLVFCIIAGNAYRRKIGGYINYGQSMKFCLGMMIVSMVTVTTFSEIYYAIDFSLPERYAAASAASLREFMLQTNAPGPSVEEAAEKLRIDTLQQFTPWGLIKNAGVGLLVYTPMCLIASLVIKRRKSVVVEEVETT